MRITKRARIATLAMICGLAVLTGCGTTDYIGPNPSQGAQVPPEHQFNQLMQRPNLDEVAARYEELRGKLKDRLQTEFGLPAWQDEDDPSTLSCKSEFPAVDSRDAGASKLVSAVTPAPIAAEKWTEVKVTLTTLGAEYGFTKVSLDIFKQPYHDFKLTDENDAQLSIATNTHTVLDLITGCHLYPAAKQRGTPAVTPT